MLKSKGVVIVATGHPNYVRMSFNLVIGLRLANKDLNICLITTKGNLAYLSEVKQQYYTDFIELDEEFYTINDNVEHPFVKVNIYDLSPYDETIYLDCDSIWCKGRDIQPLFDKFKNEDFGFTIYNKDDIFKIDSDKSIYWNKEGECIGDFRKYFTFKKDALFYHVQSSFLYFRKSKKAKQIFDTAKKLYLNRDFGFRDWANSIPDELTFDLSLSLINHKTENYYHEDIFFYPLNAGQKARANDMPNIYKNYYYISLAGNVMSQDFKDLYNRLVNYYSQQDLRINEVYLWKDKQAFLKERLIS